MKAQDALKTALASLADAKATLASAQAELARLQKVTTTTTVIVTGSTDNGNGQTIEAADTSVAVGNKVQVIDGYKQIIATTNTNAEQESLHTDKRNSKVIVDQASVGKLPTTGENNSPVAVMMGLLLTFLSLVSFGLVSKKRREN